MSDRGAFMLFWIAANMRSGVCSCGEPEGHAGWLVCFQNAWADTLAPPMPTDIIINGKG